MRAPPAWILETGRGLVVGVRVGVSVDVGPSLSTTDPAPAAGAPLIAEPLIVTGGDLKQYLSTITDLSLCLDRDARSPDVPLGGIIYQDPGKLNAEAKQLINDAAALDGCMDYYFNCPKAADATDGYLKIPAHIQADEKRKSASIKYYVADAMTARATARGIKNDAAGNAQVTAELAFYTKLSALLAEESTLASVFISQTIATSSDWKKVQALDVRYQTLRADYAALGFAPTCTVPQFTGGSTATWLKILLAVLALGVGVYAVSTIGHMVRP